jgi:hypothetical protein
MSKAFCGFMLLRHLVNQGKDGRKGGRAGKKAGDKLEGIAGGLSSINPVHP